MQVEMQLEVQNGFYSTESYALLQRVELAEFQLR